MDKFIVVLPILFPIIAGGLIWKLRPNRHNVMLATILSFILELILLSISTYYCFEKLIVILRLNDSIYLSLRIDRLSLMLSYLAIIIWLFVSIFSYEYMISDHDEHRFFGCFLMTSGTLVGVVYAANFITLYTFFELLSLASALLVLHSRKKQAIRASMVYLAYSMFGASLALFSFFFLDKYLATYTFTSGGILDLAKIAGHENEIRILAFLSIVGFGAKAGMIPLHSWLPSAHPLAPAPGSALLSGIITKAGVLAIIRMVFFTFGTSVLINTWVQYSLIAMAITSIFVGSMLAYQEKKLKKRLAYSSVSQVSYALLGIFLMSFESLYAALLQVIFHAITKNTLFLCTGAIIHKTKKKWTYDMKEVGKEMPVTMLCFTIASLSLIGLPPFAGFISKYNILAAIFSNNSPTLDYIAAVVIIISALLTAGYLLPVIISAFFVGKDFDYNTIKNFEPSHYMKIPLIIFSVSIVYLGVFGNSLFNYLRLVVLEIF